MLENHGALDSWFRDRSSVDLHASFLERKETGGDVEEGRLPAAARTDDGHELTLFDLERDFCESDDVFGLALEPVSFRNAVDD
jgi:hypothetical protein